MSYCRKEGKDQVIFVTKEDHEKQSSSNPFLSDEDEHVGLIKPDGDINWDCPCLQGMADGPCGEPFKEAFSCFHYSVTEPKGVDCLVQFKSMQECFVKYPEIYGSLDDDEEGQTDENSESNKNESESTQKTESESSNNNNKDGLTESSVSTDQTDDKNTVNKTEEAEKS